MGLAPAVAAEFRALYRAVLRLHREKLPPVMRALGDRVAVEEFRAIATSAKATEAHWRDFGDQWRLYTRTLRGEVDGASAVPDNWADERLAQLSPEQRQQLERLRGAAASLRDNERDG